MKANKIVAGVAALAMVGACGLSLAGCGGETAESTVTTYTLRIEGNEYADWKAENEQPLDMGSGHRLWGIDTWATGTKLNQDDDGNPVGAYYRYTLEIDANCVLAEFLTYTLTFTAHVPASDAYKEPSTLMYSYQGFAYAVEGGYHLLVPNYAEGAMASECLSETIGGGFGSETEDTSSYAELTGPNGGTLYYAYTNSELQAMGAQYNVPFMEPLLQGMSSCNVLVSGSDITKFEVDEIYAPEINIPEPTVTVPVVPPVDDTVDDWTALDPIEDDTVAYGFDPGWATDENKLDPADDEIVIVAGAYNTFEMMGKPMGWNNNQVTFTFKADGTVTVSMLNNQGKTNEYTGTYTVYSMMTTRQYIIQLDNIAGSENPQTGAIEGAVDWSSVSEEDAGVGGAKVGMNVFYWISKDGKIVLSKMPNAESYSFNVNMGGGDLAGEGQQPPMGEGEH